MATRISRAARKLIAAQQAGQYNFFDNHDHTSNCPGTHSETGSRPVDPSNQLPPQPATERAERAWLAERVAALRVAVGRHAHDYGVLAEVLSKMGYAVGPKELLLCTIRDRLAQPEYVDIRFNNQIAAMEQILGIDEVPKGVFIEIADPSNSAITDISRQPNRIVQVSSPSELQRCVRNCRACPFRMDHRKPVFGMGPISAPILLVIGSVQTSGANSGAPIGHSSFEILHRLIEQVPGLSIEHFFITNVLKCPVGRDSNLYTGIANPCLSLLSAQVDLLQPKIVLCLGAEAARIVCRTSGRISLNRLMERKNKSFRGVRLEVCNSLWFEDTSRLQSMLNMIARDLGLLPEPELEDDGSDL
jgi:DNA polymerase